MLLGHKIWALSVDAVLAVYEKIDKWPLLARCLISLRIALSLNHSEYFINYKVNPACLERVGRRCNMGDRFNWRKREGAG